MIQRLEIATMGFTSLLAAQSVNERKSQNYHEYFTAKQTERNTSTMVPPEMRGQYFTSVNFVRLACQALDERIQLDTVTSPDADAQAYIRQTLADNGGAAFVSTVHTAAMAGGRAYVIVSGSDRVSGTPVLTVVPARDGVHAVDPDTGAVSEFLRVYGANREKRALYTATETVYYMKDGAGWRELDRVPNKNGIPVFVYLCRETVGDPYGRPEGKDAFRLQDSATRIATDMSVASALLAVPQRALLGAELGDFGQTETDPETGEETTTNVPSGNDLYMARLLAIGDPNVKLAEFTAAQLSNFTVALNVITRQAAAALGVPLSVFGVASDSNPASGDSMRQDDSRITMRAEHLTRGFEPGWSGLARFLIQINPALDANAQFRLIWVDPTLPTLSARADAVVKLASITFNGQPLYSRAEILRRLGESEETIERMAGDTEISALAQLIGGDVNG